MEGEEPMSEWDEAAQQLARGLIRILHEIDAAPLPQTESTIREESQKIIEAIRKAAEQECDSIDSLGRSAMKAPQHAATHETQGE